MHKCVVNSDGEVRLESFPSQMHEQRVRNTLFEMPSSCVDWNATLDNSEYSRTTFGPRQSALRSLYLRSHPSRTAFSFSSAVELYAATRLLVPTMSYFFATGATVLGRVVLPRLWLQQHVDGQFPMPASQCGWALRPELEFAFRSQAER